jgi:hypothetical protein
MSELTPVHGATGRGDELHAAIMNLPCRIPFPHNGGELDEKRAYRVGHRDARHAAAELVAAAFSSMEEEVRELVEALDDLLDLAAWSVNNYSPAMRRARAVLAKHTKEQKK